MIPVVEPQSQKCLIVGKSHPVLLEGIGYGLSFRLRACLEGDSEAESDSA